MACYHLLLVSLFLVGLSHCWMAYEHEKSWRTDFRDEVNKLRAQHGLGALEMDYDVMTSANWWAQTMALDHEMKTKANVYPQMVGYRGSGCYDSASQLMEMWKEKVYRDMMLESDIKYLGVAQGYSDNNYCYMVAFFSKYRVKL